MANDGGGQMTREERAKLLLLCSELRQKAIKAIDDVSVYVSQGDLPDTCMTLAEETHRTACELSDLIEYKMRASQ